MKRYEIPASEIRPGDRFSVNGKELTLDHVKVVEPKNEPAFVWAADDWGFANNSPVVCVNATEIVEVLRDN